MPLGRRITASVFLITLLPACGGGDDAPEVRAARQMRIETAIMAEASRRETPAYACLRTVSTRLMQPAADTAALSIDCLAGSYRGKTPSGKTCEVRVEAYGSRFSFRIGEASMHVGPDSEAAKPGPKALRHGIERAEVESDQIGIRLLRGGGANAQVETLVFAGGRHDSGTADLRSVEYERVAGAQVRIVRCYLDG